MKQGYLPMRFQITTTANRIEAYASERLSFDNPRHDPYRWELARKIAGLTIRADEMLHAAYHGPEDPQAGRFDIENVLFYNVRLPREDRAPSCFCRVAANGVSFSYQKRPERRTIYEVVPVNDSHNYGRLLIDCSEIPVAPIVSDTKPWHVWVWINDWLDKHGSRPVDWDQRPFAMEIGLGGTRGNYAALIKAVFDGVISTFHSAIDVPSDIIGRVVAQVGRDESYVRRWLSRRGLLTVSRVLPVLIRGSGVQWSPHDHLCTYGTMRPLAAASRTMCLRVWSADS